MKTKGRERQTGNNLKVFKRQKLSCEDKSVLPVFSTPTLQRCVQTKHKAQSDFGLIAQV